jgi:hypothetical protein
MSADGAPALLSGAAPSAPPLAITADASATQQAAKADWGFYLNGKKLDDVKPDSIVAIEYTREWAVADFPIEGGGFGSYDKVLRPYDIRLRVTKGGKEKDRRAFLMDIETISESLDLFDIVTPIKTYLSVTVSRLGLGQAASAGVGLLTIDLGIREVRITAGVAFTNVVDPGSAATVNSGTVQAQPASAAATAAVVAKVKKAFAPASAAGAPSS